MNTSADLCKKAGFHSRFHRIGSNGEQSQPESKAGNMRMKQRKGM